MSQKSIHRFRKEVHRIIEDQEALLAMEMFRHILAMPLWMRFQIAMKIILLFKKKRAEKSQALVKKFNEFRKQTKDLIKAT